MPISQLPCRDRHQKTKAVLTPCGGGQTSEERSHEWGLSGQFGPGPFGKSRFRSRRECAKQTRKSRDLDQSVQSSERCGESVLCRARLQGRRSACSRQVDQFHVPLRQRRSSLFQPLGRKSTLHRIYPYRPPYSSMELMLCKE